MIRVFLCWLCVQLSRSAGQQEVSRSAGQQVSMSAGQQVSTSARQHVSTSVRQQARENETSGKQELVEKVQNKKKTKQAR